jgi:hypothetical protein
MTRHCHNCGWEWKYDGPPGRNDTCPQCRFDLRVCLNCARHDPRAAYECSEPKADPVADKDRASFCEWFTFARRVYQPKGGRDRATEARDAFKKLFGN